MEASGELNLIKSYVIFLNLSDESSTVHNAVGEIIYSP